MSGREHATGESSAEHYCTLFDSRYMPQAVALHSSIVAYQPSACLWALCMDEQAFQTAQRMAVDTFRPIRLADVEAHYGETLVSVRSDRTPGEYCWTVTSFLIGYVLDRIALAGEPKRATYIDADCLFFCSPARLLDRFEASGADVMITPHNYAAEYDQSETSGRFCVQFMTFKTTDRSRTILSQWQAQCAEWCYDRIEPGRFGDQKYLDMWPTEFGESVYILDDPCLALAPWNVESLHSLCDGLPQGLSGTCMYHFHGFRLLSRNRAQLYSYYRLSPDTVDRFYRPYLAAYESALKLLNRLDHRIQIKRARFSLGERYTRAVQWSRGELRTARLRVGPEPTQ